MVEKIFTQMLKPFMLIQCIIEKKTLFPSVTHVAFQSDKTFSERYSFKFCNQICSNLVPVLLLNKGLMNESNQVCYFNNRFFLFTNTIRNNNFKRQIFRIKGRQTKDKTVLQIGSLIRSQ